jgi:hypothetical protein
MSPYLIQSFNSLNRARHQYFNLPTPGNKANLQIVRSSYRKLKREEELKELEDLFSQMGGQSIGQKLQITYKYLKNYRTQHERPNSALQIPISYWENHPQSQSGPEVPLIEETDGIELTPPPPSNCHNAAESFLVRQKSITFDRDVRF